MPFTWMPHAMQSISRLVCTVIATFLPLLLFLPAVSAQAPANDVISWPPGLLLLASVLYAALGQDSHVLWVIDPSVGVFLANGLPIFALKVMRSVNWVSNSCHFVPNIRTAHGESNFWIRSNEISKAARANAFGQSSSVLNCVNYENEAHTLHPALWTLTSAGLVVPASWVVEPSALKPNTEPPTGRDFLLFAATGYHVMRGWVANIYEGEKLRFSTEGLWHLSVIDVDSEERALAVVAAHMLLRPFSQSLLRSQGVNEGSGEGSENRWRLDLKGVDLDGPICYVDFHSYSSSKAKVSASLRELAHSYLRVVSHIKRKAEEPSAPIIGPNAVATLSVGQNLWIAVLGGALLDVGRLTIQNLPGRWAVLEQSADEVYLERVEAVLSAIKPHANTPKFADLVFSNGASRRPTIAFLIAGLCGQVIICYFLSVGTSAGVWTSVAIANSLYAGKLTDWHSVYFGRTDRTSEPGLKMYVPDSPSNDVMVIATLDRAPPRGVLAGGLTPGLLLNLSGLVAAILGAVFQNQTRTSLGFGVISPTPDWVVYTSIVLSLGTSLLIVILSVLQQLNEHTWFDNVQRPTRWAICSTVFTSVCACALAAFFTRCQLARLWPVLDALVWLSGLPLGIIENGHMISIDDNMLHLVLVNRWILGAVASAVGSSAGHGLSAVC